MSSNDDEDVDKLFDSSDGEDDAPAPVTTATTSERGAEHEAEGASPIPDSAAEKDARSSPSPDRGDGAASPVDEPSPSGHRKDDEGGEASDYASPSPQVEQGPPLELQAALQDGPPSERLRLVKASNLLGVDTQPWAPSTHVYEMEHVEDPLTGVVRVQLNQRVRWRFVEAADGSIVRESNSRFVRWSDGSLQLMVGDEVLDVTETDVDNHYIYLRHNGFIQAQAHLAKRMAFRPSSITSAAHRRLKQAVRKQHTGKGRMTKITTTIADPVKEKHAQAKLEDQKIRGREGLAKKQDRMMGRYQQRPAPRFASSYGGSGLSARFLEEGDEEEVDNGEDDSLARPHQGLREEEAERRLANAKLAAPLPAGNAGKRQRPGHELDSDDEEDGMSTRDDDGKARRKRRVIALSDEDDDEDM